MDEKLTTLQRTKRMLHYGCHDVTEKDIMRVMEALRAELITTGPIARQFEEEFASYVGAKHAIAVCNGTAALHLAMLVAGIGEGDRIVTSPNTFLASANCGLYVGATPDFVDIDHRTYNLCPRTLQQQWQSDIRAVVPVHYAGGSADMPAIYEIAKSNGAVVIEDACHAVGGQIEHDGMRYRIGGHPFADMSVFSFHPVKTMTSGEGGMLVTDNDDYANQARLLRTHGMIRDPNECVGLGYDDYDERGPWYYEMQSLGFNFRITDFQCALGLSQLERLDIIVDRRREIVSRYNEAFTNHEHVITPSLRNEAESQLTSWHLYTIRVDFDDVEKTRTQVMMELRERNVGTQALYIPVHLQPYYRKRFGYSAGKCPNAELYYQQTLSLPLYPTMHDEDVEAVIQAVREVIQ